MTHITTHRNLLAIFAILALSAGLAMFTVDSASANGNPRAITVTGISEVDGEQVLVRIIAAVNAGKSDQEVAAAALRGVNARSITAQEFSTIDITWDQFLDGPDPDDFVVQRYNSKKQPSGAREAIDRARATWNGADSPFAFQTEMESTGKCPSLVAECRGAQTFDGNNDIAWMRLNDPNTLGVTWSGIDIDEADVAFNTKFSWSNSGANFDIETVALHEFGHVAGLGHSLVGGSIMEATYAGVRRTLTADDVSGLQFKYGTGSGEPPPEPTFGSISGTVIDSGTGQPISGANVSTGSGESDATDGSGVYTITNVPTGSASVTASASGYASSTKATDVTDGGTAALSFSLAESTTGTATVTSITYSESGGKNNDKDLRVTLNTNVGGAAINIALSRNGTVIANGAGTTGSGGDITFRLRNAASGTYTTEVTGLSANGYTWDGETPDNSHNKQ